MTITIVQWLIASLAIGAGAALQGSIGFGMALIASPILVMVDPRFIPVPYMLSSLILSVSIVRRERRSVDLSGVKWAVIGRIPATLLASWLLVVAPQDIMVLVFGVFVLLAVAISAFGIKFPPVRINLLGAGFLSGIMGTIATIGGPPIAIVYQDSESPTLRSTLSGYFIFGAALTVVTLFLYGEVGWAEVFLALALCPGIIMGYQLSSRLLPYIKKEHTRTGVLILATVSALVVIIRQLLKMF